MKYLRERLGEKYMDDRDFIQYGTYAAPLSVEQQEAVDAYKYGQMLKKYSRKKRKYKATAK